MLSHAVRQPMVAVVGAGASASAGNISSTSPQSTAALACVSKEVWVLPDTRSSIALATSLVAVVAARMRGTMAGARRLSKTATRRAQGSGMGDSVALGRLRGSVYLWQTPLGLPGPLPAELADWLPKHAVVLAEREDGGFAAFDFEPADKDSFSTAATLLSGGSVPGRFGARALRRLPSGVVRVGRAVPGASADEIPRALNASFDPALSLWSNDCNTYATAVLDRILANSRASTGGRLYSTLDTGALEDKGTVIYKEPSLIGAVVLVAGTTIGAGILALPAVTQPVGFVPSTAALALAWVYMATTGLLIAEVAIAEMASSGKRATSLQSMATRTIGPAGAAFSSAGFVVVHFGLLVAYMSRGGQLLAEALPGLQVGIPFPAVFAAFFGGLIFATKGTDFLELFNNVAAAVVLASFFVLVALAAPSVEPNRLFSVADWAGTSDIAPTLLLSLVYHNVVPTICAQLEGDRQKIWTAIVLGSFVPFLMFLLWNGVILAAVPPGAATGIDPLDVLRASGGSLLSSGVLAFSLSAIVTSFVGFVLALTDFFADAFRSEGSQAAEETGMEKVRNFALTLLPPLAVACYDPSLFFQAIDKAGAFGVSMLFGLLPAWMSLAQRARESPVLTRTPEFVGGYVRGPLVPGGVAALAVVAGGAIWVVVDNLLELVAA